MRSAPFRAAIALLLTLLGGELLVRLCIGTPSTHLFDPEIGYRYRPGSDLFQTKEGFNRLHFNGLGLNDVEVGPKGDRCRVLVVGDSYTAALQVPQAENFTSVAERLEPRLDVINAGRDGLFLGDLHKVASRFAAPLSVDLVVYEISQRAIEADIRLADFSIVSDPRDGTIVDALMRVEEKESLKELFEPLLRNSALATRLAAQLQPSVAQAMQQAAGMREAMHGMRGDVLAAPEPVIRHSDEDVLTFVFRRMAAVAPTGILYINALQYRPDRTAIVAPTSAQAEIVARRAAALAGVRFYSTGAALVKAFEQSGQPPYGFTNALLPGGHLNVRGHRAVGQVLVDVVREMGDSLPAQCRAR